MDYSSPAHGRASAEAVQLPPVGRSVSGGRARRRETLHYWRNDLYYSQVEELPRKVKHTKAEHNCRTTRTSTNGHIIFGNILTVFA